MGGAHSVQMLCDTCKNGAETKKCILFKIDCLVTSEHWNFESH